MNLSEKRQEIIDTAILLMQSKGYENTKLSEVLEASKIGKGQFYYYFSSKQELGMAVVDCFSNTWSRQLLDNILKSNKDSQTKFDEMFEWIIEDQKSNSAKTGCFFGNLAIELSEHDEIFRQKIQLVFDNWINALKPVLIGMLNNTLEPDSPELDNLAHGVVALIEGGILLMKSKQDINILINIAHLARKLVYSFSNV
ncbi:MAG: TetR family transcriptional regulator [Clostridiales bacterium]|nr:TetR family transcriptional regulator [Clostridiales bacterium]